MLSEKNKKALKEKYNIHPLIIFRSVERAKTDVELFDILHSFPKKFPIKWSEEKSCWIECNKNEYT